MLAVPLLCVVMATSIRRTQEFSDLLGADRATHNIPYSTVQPPRHNEGVHTVTPNCYTSMPTT